MKYTLNTVFFGLFFGIFMLLSILLFIPYWLLKLFRMEKGFNRFTHWATSTWGKFVFLLARCKMKVTGLENLPEHNRIIYIGNHQGYADIPFMMANLPTTIGFIAKRELSKVPILGLWMRAVHCMFIDRGNFRKAMRDIEVGIAEATKGYPKVIFPEGTRSRCEKMAPFKPGSILLAAKAGLTIVPVTINGTYKTYEERKKIWPAELSLTVHPYIDTVNLNDEERKQLSEKLWAIVAGALPNKGY